MTTRAGRLILKALADAGYIIPLGPDTFQFTPRGEEESMRCVPGSRQLQTLQLLQKLAEDPEVRDNFRRVGRGLVDFMTVWGALAREGVTPPGDLEEYRRVLDAWRAAGSPEAIGDFIRRTVRRP